ncbi:MAG TPA: hypothetical protein VJL78_09475 [Candidatus Nitrosocosmicus sp.]|nr:hypothetical protein [Candidatus Nitrosocosmicus sp.]
MTSTLSEIGEGKATMSSTVTVNTINETFQNIRRSSLRGLFYISSIELKD